jgi:hypothetical protein
MSTEARQRFDEVLAEAGIEPGELTTTGREVLAMLATAGRFTCTGVCDLVATARRAGEADAEEAADCYEDGVPFFRHDATVTVTVGAAELAERGMPDKAVIGVAWGDGDQCIHHALAGANERAATNPNDRGILIYRGWWLECRTCTAVDRPTNAGSARQGTDRFTMGLVIDVARVLEAHGYGPFVGGRPHVELQQHLLHLLHGKADASCSGRRIDGAR